MTTDYRGASPEIIESQVTQPLEEVLSGIEGVDLIVSQSREGRSQISVRFRIDRDQDSAAADVRDRVSRARRQPARGGRRAGHRQGRGRRAADHLSGPVLGPAVADRGHRLCRPRSSRTGCRTCPGVAEVRIFGARTPAMRIWLDRLRLAAYGLTPQDVEAALRRQNIEVPAGRIESQQREFTVLAETDLRTAEQFNDLIITRRRRLPGPAARMSARPRSAPATSARSPASWATRPWRWAWSSSRRPIRSKCRKRSRRRCRRIAEIMPDGMKIDVGYDSSIFIAKSIENVFRDDRRGHRPGRPR